MHFLTFNFGQKKKIYFKDMAKGWLLYKKCTVKKSTYYNYKYVIDKYLLVEFDNCSIDDFSEIDINSIIESMLGRLSAKMIKDILCVFKSILKYSEDTYKCKIEIKPIAIPKVITPDLKILTRREQLKLEKYCLKKEENNQEDHRYLGIVLCLYTGLRIGEICALRWEDIDLKNKCIRVTKTLQRVYIGKNRTKILIDTPKSAKSSRKIPINDKLLNLLTPEKEKKKKSSYFLTGTRKIY